MKRAFSQILLAAATVVMLTTTYAAAHDHSHMPDWTSWTPSADDSCTSEAHQKHTVIGPDGLQYDTWHPSSENGCTYGHEHGDDPTTSDIYEWTRSKLAAEGHEDQSGLPFGYVSHASQVYAESEGAAPHRHEDHVGHKVFVLNNVKLVHSDRSQGYVRDEAGNPVVCDYLIKMHQGSHSPDATRNNAHELIYAMQCTNGAEAVISLLTPIGKANEFTANCDESTVTTSGSNSPDGAGGRRLIPTKQCVENYNDVWGLYETWETDTTLTDSSGKILIHFDPWFGVRNPSRIYDTETQEAVPAVSVADLLGNAKSEGIPWYRVDGKIEKSSLLSPFNGAKRDVYVGGTQIHNADGPTTWYTDPYGGHLSTAPFPGAVKQYIANVDIPDVEVGRQVFGWNTDYGPNGSGVHAPN